MTRVKKGINLVRRIYASHWLAVKPQFSIVINILVSKASVKYNVATHRTHCIHGDNLTSLEQHNSEQPSRRTTNNAATEHQQEHEGRQRPEARVKSKEYITFRRSDALTAPPPPTPGKKYPAK